VLLTRGNPLRTDSVWRYRGDNATQTKASGEN
jgi:hypothetical protein